MRPIPHGIVGNVQDSDIKVSEFEQQSRYKTNWSIYQSITVCPLEVPVV